MSEETKIYNQSGVDKGLIAVFLRMSPEERLRANDNNIPAYSLKISRYGLGVVTYKGWLGHSGGVVGSMCNVYINPKADVIIIHYLNTLDCVNLKQNEANLKVLGELLQETMRITVPGSVQD